jgi:hypothetical protein
MGPAGLDPSYVPSLSYPPASLYGSPAYQVMVPRVAMYGHYASNPPQHHNPLLPMMPNGAADPYFTPSQTHH